MSSRWIKARSESIQRYLAAASKASILTLSMLLGGWANCDAQPGSNSMPVPIRVFTIYVQVSLPNGRPAAGALVTLAPNSGVPRTAFANDSGRIEFPGMAEGQYTLSAVASRFKPDLGCRSDEDPSRTANGSLTVHLQLHDRSDRLKIGNRA
jgi:hypothetical protein